MKLTQELKSFSCVKATSIPVVDDQCIIAQTPGTSDWSLFGFRGSRMVPRSKMYRIQFELLRLQNIMIGIPVRQTKFFDRYFLLYFQMTFLHCLNINLV